MYGWCHTVLTTALLVQTVHAASILPKNERCVTAAYTALNYLSFEGEPTTGFWQTRCQNCLKVTSIYAAAEIYCNEDEKTAGFAQLDALCRSSANIELLPRHTVAENLTEEKIKHLEVVDFWTPPRDEIFGSPVLISSAYYDRVFRTIVRDIAIHNGGKLGYYANKETALGFLGDRNVVSLRLRVSVTLASTYRTSLRLDIAISDISIGAVYFRLEYLIDCFNTWLALEDVPRNVDVHQTTYIGALIIFITGFIHISLSLFPSRSPADEYSDSMSQHALTPYLSRDSGY